MMTQDEFDRRFYRAFRAGYGILIAGIILMVFVGLPAALLADTFAPFLLSAGVSIVGGFICGMNFAHDIFFNPRWRP
jgi:hypothetical protein